MQPFFVINKENIMRIILKIVVVACAYFIGFQQLYAIKATPHPVTVTQPDGTTLTIRLQGDEFGNYRTTEDGYLLSQNDKGYYVYDLTNTNIVDKTQQLIARDVTKRSANESSLLRSISKADPATIYAAKAQRAKPTGIQRITKVQKAFPLTGSPKSLVILVNFSDKNYVVSTPQVAYTNLLTQVGYSANGGTGSARDYFMSASMGKFSPTFDVVGPYTLPNNMAFYGKNDSNGDDSNPQQMIIDACTKANDAGLDFTQYDTDNDGMLDNVFVYYAGYNEAEGGPTNTVWPHRWTLADKTTKFDGKTVYDYACTSELNSSTGSNMCGIGTFSHEFGHVLGLPDYYHTTANKNTLNDWTIMDSGAYNNNGRTPPNYSSYDRFFLGWLTPQQVNTSDDFTLLPLYQETTIPANTNQQTYLLSATSHNLNGGNPTPKEFFMVEYRKKTSWDTYLPGEGMLIWHIDYDQTAWDNNSPNNYTGTNQTASSHMRVYLQPLSGNTSTPGAAFTIGAFTPTTWSGTNIGREITAIAKTPSNVTFKLMGGKAGPTINVTGSVSEYSTYVGTPSSVQSITVSGTLLTENIALSLTDQSHFDIKLNTDINWGKTVSIPLTGSNASAVVNVRFNPTVSGNFSTILTMQSALAETKTLSISGIGITPIDPNATAIVIGKVENALVFTATNLNLSKSKTLNIKTTDIISNLSIAITGTNASMFKASVTSLTKENANAIAGKNITITYQPTAIGTHTATLTISGGGLNPAKVITLTGEGK